MWPVIGPVVPARLQSYRRGCSDNQLLVLYAALPTLHWGSNWAAVFRGLCNGRSVRGSLGEQVTVTGQGWTDLVVVWSSPEAVVETVVERWSYSGGAAFDSSRAMGRQS